ncbi:hypothetical protein BC828DRAFT_373425 [Blastocladiella britannica]|nr:hypothetical protein BC828DRAFT_373425 [Blastocladiella britannica]
MRGTKLHAHDEEPDESPSPTAKSPRRQPLSVKATAGAAKAALSTSPNQHLATAAADSSTSPTSPRKRKNIFPADKRAILLKYYQEVTKTPSRNQRQELVEQVGSNEKTIRIWFQNHRQKFAEMAKRSRKGGAQRELTASSTHGSMHNLANSSTHFMQTTPAPGGVAGAAGSMHSLYMGSSDSHIVYGPSPLPHMLAGPTSTPAGGTIIHPPPPQQMPVPHASFPGAAAAFAKVAMTHGHLHNGQPQQQFGPGTHPTTSAAGTPDRRMVTTIAGGSPPVAAYPPLPPYGMYSTGSVPEPGMQFNGGPGHPMHFQPMMQQQPRPHPYYQQQQQLQQGFARASPMMMMVPGAPMPQFGGSPVMTIMPNPMPPQTRQVNGGGLMYMPSSAATMPSALGLMSGTVLGGSGLPFSGMPPTTLFQVPLEKPAPTSSHGGSPQQSTRGADANPGGAANGFHI